MTRPEIDYTDTGILIHFTNDEYAFLNDEDIKKLETEIKEYRLRLKKWLVNTLKSIKKN